MENIGKILLDLFVFFLIIILSKLTIEFFDGVIHTQRDTRSMMAALVILISTTTYSYLKNKPHLLSIGYGIIVSFILLITVDSNSMSVVGIVLSVVFVIGLIYYGIKQNQQENSETKNIDTVDINEFVKIGELDNTPEYKKFIEKTELKINKSAYRNYKPMLIKKNINKNNELFLDYSNKDDLSFTVIIDNKNDILIKHKKEIKNTELINRFIFDSIKTVC